MKKIWMTMAFCLCSLPAFAQLNVQANTQGTVTAPQPIAPVTVPGQVPRLQPTTPSISPTTPALTATTPTPGAQTAIGGQATTGTQATTNTNLPVTLTGQAFVDQKNGMVKSAADRIVVLQQQEKCLRAATTAAAVNACGAADTGCLVR